jgi:hypothetical protein
MKIIYDDENGDVVVVLHDVGPGMPAHATHQYQKFGVTMYWDGHGELLGFRFSQEVSVQPEFKVSEWAEVLPLRDQDELVAHAAGRR